MPFSCSVGYDDRFLQQAGFRIAVFWAISMSFVVDSLPDRKEFSLRTQSGEAKASSTWRAFTPSVQFHVYTNSRKNTSITNCFNKYPWCILLGRENWQLSPV